MTRSKFETSNRKRETKDRLEILLLEGLGSPDTELTPENWADIRKQALAKLEERNKKLS